MPGVQRSNQAGYVADRMSELASYGRGDRIDGRGLWLFSLKEMEPVEGF